MSSVQAARGLCLLLNRRPCRLAWMKEFLKDTPPVRRWLRTGCGRQLSACIGIRPDIRRCTGFFDLRAIGFILVWIRPFLVVTCSQSRGIVFEINRGDHCKRIILAGWSQRLEFGRVGPLLHGNAFVENSRCNRAGHRSAMFATIYHHRHGITRLFIRCETTEPRDSVLVFCRAMPALCLSWQPP